MEAINQADTAWLMVSCALVMLMTPGLALFYGGMVGAMRRGKGSTPIFMAKRAITWAALEL